MNDKFVNQLLDISPLYEKVSVLIEQSQEYVAKTVNSTMVVTYYRIGQYIVEEEQRGQERATYGKQVLQLLSQRLTDRYGAGWSIETLNKCRKFYRVYGISSTAWTKSDSKEIVYSVDEIHLPHLPWSHLQILMRIQNPEERRFYEIESQRENWSVRQLQRQVGSSLYERLALSRDKDEVLCLASEGHVVEKPTDLLKNPLVLEFVSLQPETSYSESKFETAIINKMQQFLLELGKGFLFEACQKHLIGA